MVKKEETRADRIRVEKTEIGKQKNIDREERRHRQTESDTEIGTQQQYCEAERKRQTFKRKKRRKLERQIQIDRQKTEIWEKEKGENNRNKIGGGKQHERDCRNRKKELKREWENRREYRES